MLHRIFIAINLPESLKNELLSYRETWPSLPVRWTKSENLHITLVFLGNVSDQELEELKMKTREVAKKHRPFQLSFTKIVYGPTKKNPKMIWAIGEESKELFMLQRDLSKSSLRDSVPKLGTESLESPNFTVHITLARIKAFEFSRINGEERPQINEEISLKIPVNSIEIMESKLKRTGPEYTICESILLA